MNLKKKLRRAFQNATPDVLNRILKEMSADKDDISVTAQYREASPAEKQAARKERFQEFIATAAALALLIGACGSGVWYLVRNQDGTNTGNNSGGINDPAPTFVTLAKDELYDHLIEVAKNSVAPEDRDNIMPTGEYQKTTVDGADAYVVSVTYKGYIYELTYAEAVGVLNISASRMESAQENEYITDCAASSIAYTQVDDSLAGTNYAWFRDNTEIGWNGDGIACYYVTLRRHPINDFSNYEYKTFCIGAYTGLILEVQEFKTAEHTGMATDYDIMNSLWQLITEDVTQATRWENTKITRHVIEGDLVYRFRITYDGYVYLFETDISGEIHAIEVLSDPDTKGNYIAKGVALEIVRLAYGIDIGDGQKVQILCSSDCYHITFVDDPVHSETTYVVNAYTGGLVEDSALSLTNIRDIALSHHNISLNDCYSLVMEAEDEGTEYERIRVLARCGTGVYVAAVRTSDGEIVDQYVLMTVLPAYMENKVPVSWQTARDTALENCRLSLAELTSLSIGYDEEQNIYEFYFGIFPAEHACSVDAITGQMINPVIDPEYISEEEAWEVMLAELSEDTNQAYIAGAADCHYFLQEDSADAYYELWLSWGEATYVALVDAKTGTLLDLCTIVPETEPTPPDGKIDEEIAIKQAIDALVGGDDVEVTVLSCSFVETDDGDCYIVRYFAGGCYYRVAIGAYGMGHLWHDGYDYEDTLNGFSEIFSDMGSWENMALTHTYDGPSQIDISIFFYNGVGDVSALTAEELAFLKSAGYLEEFDAFRLPVRKMNEILQAYFGCTLEDVNTDTFRDVAYLESTDCYYLWHTDARLAENFQAIGLIQDGDIYQMYYRLGGDTVYVTTFEVIGGNMLIYSNLAVELYQ